MGEEMSEEWALPPVIVGLIADLWGGKDLRPLSNAKNLVFAFQLADGPGVLRIHTQGERDEALVLAELDWVQFLYASGVRVPPPLPTLDGRWAVRFPLNEETSVYAAAFRLMPGVHPDIRIGDRWNLQLVERMGEVLGRMHALSVEYEPPAGLHRFDWTRQDLPLFVSTVIPPNEKSVRQKFKRHWSRMQSMPRDKNGYGLTHGDYHTGNLLVDDAGVTVIDFDNCCYNWYVADIAHFIAMSLFPLAQDSPARRNQAASILFETFMRGYQRFHTLSDTWLEFLPNFLLNFDLVFYLNMRARGPELPKKNPLAPYINYAKSNVEKGQAGVNLDFVRLYARAQGKAVPEISVGYPAEKPGGLFERLLRLPGRFIQFLQGREDEDRKDAPK
jgi:Ser/Thr protein kinase RdoA (MazF antagonist)